MTNKQDSSKDKNRYKHASKFIPTAADKAKITLMAKYIGHSVNHGASPKRAVEGAMSVIRRSGGLG